MVAWSLEVDHLLYFQLKVVTYATVDQIPLKDINKVPIWQKGFDQLLGARSTQKLVEIHNTGAKTNMLEDTLVDPHIP